MKTELKPNEVIVWKILTKSRRSCYTSEVLIETSPFVIQYPINKWIRPPKGTKIYTFKSYEDAEEWLAIFAPSLLSMKKGYQIVKAIGKNPSKNPSNMRVAPLTRYPRSTMESEGRIKLMWKRYNHKTKLFKKYRYDFCLLSTPEGTTTVTHLKCLE